MRIEKIIELIEGEIVTENPDNEIQISLAFCSDLMSDVLTINHHQDDIALLTGLANVQTIRTVEMAGLNLVILVRGKKANNDMIEIAKENDITIIETKYSAFRTSAILYNAGIKSLF
jgi:predicted transcriptional regulator